MRSEELREKGMNRKRKKRKKEGMRVTYIFFLSDAD